MSRPMDRERLQRRPSRRVSATRGFHWSQPGFLARRMLSACRRLGWSWLVNRLGRFCQHAVQSAGTEELAIELGARCTVGTYGDSNQDRCYADRYRKLFVVADGVGGHVGGERASQAVIEVVAARLGDVLSSQPLSLRHLEKAICKTLIAANQELIELAQEHPDLVGMSSTVTIGVVSDNRLLICHVGDSRAYLSRNHILEQLTNDDTLVQGLVATDTLTAGEARRHPMRQLLIHSLGTWPLKKNLRTDRFQLQPGDRLLFTTDGLTDVVSKRDLQRILDQHADPREAADCMVEYARLAGSAGNITCIVVNLEAG